MIKVTAKIIRSGLDAILDELIPFVLPVRVGKRVFETIEQPFLADLQRIPGPVARPIEWTRSGNPNNRPPNMPDGTYSKQKAKFFATNGFGRGIPTKRTGRMARAWVVRSAIQAGRFRIIAENPIPESKFVYGFVSASSLSEAQKPQQRFHRNTGWHSAYSVSQRWMNTTKQEIRKEVQNEVEQIRARIRRRSRRS
jgi:hypothetical protein